MGSIVSAFLDELPWSLLGMVSVVVQVAWVAYGRGEVTRRLLLGGPVLLLLLGGWAILLSTPDSAPHQGTLAAVVIALSLAAVVAPLAMKSRGHSHDT